jgi:hypothetical protein
MSVRGARVSAVNSRTEILINGIAFTGLAEEVIGWSSAVVSAHSDVASAVLGFSTQQSSDGINWDFSESTTLSAGVGVVLSAEIVARYFRVVYTNGGITQGTFRLQTIYSAARPSGRVLATPKYLVSDGNSSVAALPADTTFPGAYVHASEYSAISVILVKDTTSSGKLFIVRSIDGVVDDRTKMVVYPVGSNGGEHTLDVISGFMKVAYTNDAVGMTTFRLQTKFHASQSTALTSTLDQPISIRNDVALVRDPTLPTLDIAREFEEGKSAETIWGYNQAVSTAFTTLWPTGGIKIWETAATTVGFSSGSTEDKGYSRGRLQINNNNINNVRIGIGAGVTSEYTFKTTLTGGGTTPYEVLVGATETDSELNLNNAINNAGGNPGVDYGTGGITNTQVRSTNTGGFVTVYSLNAYPLANEGKLEIIPLSSSSAILATWLEGGSTLHPLGAQSIEIHGLDATGAFITEILVLDGLDTVDTNLTYLRINKCHVQTVGTSNGSNFSTITGISNGIIRVSIQGFGMDSTSAYGHGEGGKGFTSIPLGKTAYITKLEVTVDANKSSAADVVLYEREGIALTDSSFLPRRIIWRGVGIVGSVSVNFPSHYHIKELTDLFFEGIRNGNTDVEVNVSLSYYLMDSNSLGK